MPAGNCVEFANTPTLLARGTKAANASSKNCFAPNTPGLLPFLAQSFFTLFKTIQMQTKDARRIALLGAAVLLTLATALGSFIRKL